MTKILEPGEGVCGEFLFVLGDEESGKQYLNLGMEGVGVVLFLLGDEERQQYLNLRGGDYFVYFRG